MSTMSIRPMAPAALLSRWNQYPKEFMEAVPTAAVPGAVLLLLMAWLMPVGFVLVILASFSASFSSPVSSHIPLKQLTKRTVKPLAHNPHARKVLKSFVPSREGNSYYFPTQTFPRSNVSMLIRNRFTMADMLSLTMAVLFLCYAPELLDCSFSKLAIDLVCGSFATYLWFNTLHWLKTGRPLAGKTHSDAKKRGGRPFLIDSLDVKRNPNGSRYHWVPKAHYGNEKVTTERGLATVGTDYWCFLIALLTWTELNVHALYRLVVRDLGFAPGAALAGENIYKAIVNTCLVCWFDTQDSQLVFHDILLPFNSTDLKLWAKITLDVDPTNRTVGRLTLEPYNNGEDEVEVLTTTNLAEVSSVVSIIITLVAHPCVHFWANAVEEVTTADWKLSTMAHNHTQGFNNAAVLSTSGTLGHATSADWMGAIASHGIRGGLPVHNNGLEAVAKHSTAHSMITACRKALAKIRPDDVMPKMKREAIIQATVMHAIDHHYIAKYLPACANSELLNSSTQMIATAIIPPIDYKTRKVMVKHYIATDDICAALYEACAAHDKQFADDSLTVGVLI